MFIQLVAALSLSQLVISGITALYVWHGSKSEESVELKTLAVLFLSSAPNFFMSAKAIAAIFYPDLPWDVLIAIYGFSVVLSYLGFSLFARRMFQISGMIAGGFNYWKQWKIILFVFFFAISPIIVFNTHPLILDDGGMIYKTIVLNDSTFGFVTLAITELVFVPFLIKLLSLNLKNKSRTGRINGTVLLAFYELLGLSIFYPALFGNTTELIIVGFLVQNVCSLVLLFLFRHAYAIESMFMQLTIESVHVSTDEGSVLHSIVFIPGKFYQGNDDLIGNMMKGTDTAVLNILGKETAGLQRIVLEDGTNLIMERSVHLPLMYIVCTRSFSFYTRSRVRELRRILDERLGAIKELDKHVVETVIPSTIISNVFLN